MPNRVIREGIIDSDAVNSLSWAAEVFYRRLMSVVDDFGRFDARPSILRGRLYALHLRKVSDSDVSSWMAECQRAGLVSVYHHAGKPYLAFHKLGSPRAKDSKFPPPPADAGGADCEQTRADANICEQTRADVPYSYSGSGSYSSTGSRAKESPEPAEPASGLVGGSVEMPVELDTEEFRTAWGEWKADRAARKLKPYTPQGERAQLRKLAKFGPVAAAEAIHESIAQQWQGIFPKEAKAATAGRQRQETLLEKNARIQREIEERNRAS